MTEQTVDALGVATGAGAGQLPALRRPLVAVAVHLGVLLLALLVASLAIFLALHVLPGDQASVLAGVDATPAQVAALRHELGADRPVIVQYGDWLARALRGDLGTSLLDHRSVAGAIGEKLQVTLPLCLLSLVLSVAVALPLGMVAGARRRTWYGVAIGALSQLGIALPVFVVGFVLVATVAVRWQLLPAQGFPADRWADPGDALLSLLLPAVTLAIPQSAVFLRFVRSATIDVMSRDWMRTARSQGWSLAAALVRQGLRNAALPLVSVLGLELAALLTGSVIVERVYSLPGIGGMIIADVGNRDITEVQGTLIVLTSVVMIITMALNLVSVLIDPRLKVRR